MYRILQLLTPEEVEECRKIAAAAPFVHGRITNPHNFSRLQLVQQNLLRYWAEKP